MTYLKEEPEAPKLDLSRAVWRKSTYSGGNGSCVEVAYIGNFVAVRDSKDKTGPRLILTPDAWRRFMQSVKVGARDL